MPKTEDGGWILDESDLKEYHMPEAVKIGDTVTWSGQLRGSKWERTGKVLEIVLAGQNVDELIPSEEPLSHRRYTTVTEYARALVAVPAGAYGGLTHYYAPKLSELIKK